MVTPVQAQVSKTMQKQSEQTPPYPSEQMLEFLADFGNVDEQTFELIEYHALQRDAQAPQEKKDDE